MGDNDYDTWEDWCDSDMYCGFLPDDEGARLPVIICAPVFGIDMDEPLRVRPDNWDAC